MSPFVPSDEGEVGMGVEPSMGILGVASTILEQDKVPSTTMFPFVVTLPVLSSTVNLSVSTAIPPSALTRPVTPRVVPIVTAPVVSRVDASRSPRVVSPVTPKVPAIAVFPVVSATVNLSVSHVIPPFADRAPPTSVFRLLLCFLLRSLPQTVLRL